MTTSPSKTPAWLLERLAQGELDAAEIKRVRARLAAEGRSLDAELAALARSNQDLLAAWPRQAAAAAIRERAAGAERTAVPARRRYRAWSLWAAPLVLAGSLGVALLIVRGPHPSSSPTDRPEDEETRVKGDLPSASGPRLLVYRQRAGAGSADTQPERLADGARAAHGDLLQLAYAAAHEGLYGVLLSIDGAGRVTQHLPERQKGEGDGDGAGGASVASLASPLRSAREIRLSSAYELDDAPAFERFVLITATQPFPVAVAVDAARALAARALAADGARVRSLPLPLTPSFHQVSVFLHKTSKGTP